MSKYLISETTKEERKKIVDNALAISALGGASLSEEKKAEKMKLYQKYIDGEMEASEIEEIIINKYKGKNNERSISL